MGSILSVFLLCGFVVFLSLASLLFFASYPWPLLPGPCLATAPEQRQALGLLAGLPADLAQER